MRIVAYERVSTARQGASGLGIAAHGRIVLDAGDGAPEAPFGVRGWKDRGGHRRAPFKRLRDTTHARFRAQSKP